jgi:hypothetical protein
MIITEINVGLQAFLRLDTHRRMRGRKKKDKDTGYLKGTLIPNSDRR